MIALSRILVKLPAVNGSGDVPSHLVYELTSHVVARKTRIALIRNNDLRSWPQCKGRRRRPSGFMRVARKARDGRGCANKAPSNKRNEAATTTPLRKIHQEHSTVTTPSWPKTELGRTENPDSRLSEQGRRDSVSLVHSPMTTE